MLVGLCSIEANNSASVSGSRAHLTALRWKYGDLCSITGKYVCIQFAL